jgi:DNA-binding NtrC family response regulator
MIHDRVLLCWDSPLFGKEVLPTVISLFAEKKIHFDQYYLLYTKNSLSLRAQTGETTTERLALLGKSYGEKLFAHEIDTDAMNVDNHNDISETLIKDVIPAIKDKFSNIEISINSGTKAMHTVWYLLYAQGAFNDSTRLWAIAEDLTNEDARSKLTQVIFKANSFYQKVEFSKGNRGNANRISFRNKSPTITNMQNDIVSYFTMFNCNVLLLGERGTGKTTLVETVIKEIIKKDVVYCPCGSIPSNLIEDELFGHIKGAFTDAERTTCGLIKQADNNFLFLDEIQDLDKKMQRKLIDVIQNHRYKPVGSDTVCTSNFGLICSSNVGLKELSARLCPDFFDRIAQMYLSIPPLRDRREDIRLDWDNTWMKICETSPLEIPKPLWNSDIEFALLHNPLYGNFRDIEKLVRHIILAVYKNGTHMTETIRDQQIKKGIAEWQRHLSEKSQATNDNPEDDQAGTPCETDIDSRPWKEQVWRFKRRLAEEKIREYGSPAIAAQTLNGPE